MMRRSLGSMFWGVVLVGIGALLLARNFGYAFPYWNLVPVYWPLLIILWGVVKLGDYFRLRNTHPHPRLFSTGEVVLLLFVILAGSAVTVAANISSDVGQIFGIGEIADVWSLTGNNFEYTEHAELAVEPGAVIDAFNLYGSVDVRPGTSNRIVLEIGRAHV